MATSLDPADRSAARSLAIEWPIVASCALFICVLALAALFDPSIRILHFLQALIYIAIIALARQRSAWGYGAGCVIAAFWNWTNLVHTTFIKAGVIELMRLVSTGRLQHPDLFIAIFAAAAHFVLITASIAGYFQIRARTFREPVKFWTGGVLAVAYFVVIIILTGPQYIPLLKRVFGLN
jgi:hypothetical protein